MSNISNVYNIDSYVSKAYFVTMTKPNMYLVGGEKDRTEEEYSEQILRNLLRLIETSDDVSEKYNQHLEPFGVEANSSDSTIKIFIYNHKEDPLADITFYSKLVDTDFMSKAGKDCINYVKNDHMLIGPLSETFMLNRDGTISRAIYQEITDAEHTMIPELSVLIDRDEMIEDHERDALISLLEKIGSL